MFQAAWKRTKELQDGDNKNGSVIPMTPIFPIEDRLGLPSNPCVARSFQETEEVWGAKVFKIRGAQCF